MLPLTEQEQLEVFSKLPKDKITPELIELLKKTGIEQYANTLLSLREDSLCRRKLKKFITQNPLMLTLKSNVERLTEVDDAVLIIGESGTGKELLAQALHGERKGKFIDINCAGIPENLIEAELFGYEKGAFTGASMSKDGLFVTAKDGTLFLDEIGDLAYPMQSKILRVIQEKEVRKIGGRESIKINCRIVAATHRDLSQWVLKDKFREDLYYRLSTFSLKPTPLRMRELDIPLIVDNIDEEGFIEEKYPGGIGSFCKLIVTNKLKGNVRSLQQIVRRYIVLGLEPHEEI